MPSQNDTKEKGTNRTADAVSPVDTPGSAVLPCPADATRPVDTPDPAGASKGIELNRIGGMTSQQEVQSYGVHRFSTATRLVITFALVALVTAAIFAAVQVIINIALGNVLAQEFAWGMAAAAALAIIAATLVGLFSARDITMPIAKISSTINEIKTGSYAARTGFTGYDEIGRLGSTFDEMADIIQRNSEYEKQITVDVAHELRTPLTAIQANLEAMIDGIIPADPEHLATVNSEVLRLGRLTEEQLKLSRLEARMVVFNPQKLDLGALISKLISNYKLLVEGSGLVLDVEAEKDVYIYADPDMVRQVAANLISNAVRYTPEGGSIKVSVHKRGRAAELQVDDTGVGIAKEDLDRIFKKFQRVKSDRNRDTGGLGIGLATVREIVDIHSGAIAVESQLESGSSFIISFPLSAS